MMLHIPRRGLRIGIIPGRIRVFLPVHDDRVVPCLTLPRTARSRRACPQKLPLHRILRKVDVPLDRLKRLALGQGLTIPNCLRHRIRFSVFSISYGAASTQDIPSPETLDTQSLHAFVTETHQNGKPAIPGRGRMLALSGPAARSGSARRSLSPLDTVQSRSPSAS